jgi:hypothetical protein
LSRHLGLRAGVLLCFGLIVSAFPHAPASASAHAIAHQRANPIDDSIAFAGDVIVCDASAALASDGLAITMADLPWPPGLMSGNDLSLHPFGFVFQHCSARFLVARPSLRLGPIGS